MSDRTLIELVEDCVNRCVRGSVFFSEHDAEMARALIDKNLAEIRQRLAAVERDAAEGRAAKACAIKYLRFLSVEDAEAGLAKDMSNPDMAGEYAMEAANVPER